MLHVLCAILGVVGIAACQSKNVFTIEEFEIKRVSGAGVSVLSLSFQAMLTSAVEKPYLEIQLLYRNGTIPKWRYKCDLCGSRMLNCPSVQGFHLQFDDQLPLANISADTIKLIFREGKTKLACYSAPCDV